VFVLVGQLQPSLTFARERLEPTQVKHRKGLHSKFTQNDRPGGGVTGSEKRSSLLQRGGNYGHKKFCRSGRWTEIFSLRRAQV
jgi:hypothetical protein